LFFVALSTANASGGTRFFSTLSNGNFQVQSEAGALPTQIFTYTPAAGESPSSSSLFISNAVPFLYSVVIGSTYTSRLNGVVNTFSPISTGSHSSTRLTIGNLGYATSGANSPAASNAFTGLMGEVIMYNTSLTTTQRQGIESYLSFKWGLSNVYTTIPGNISGLSLWLDAADSTSITLSGSKVTQWNDKSGNGRNVTQSTDSLRPTYSAASNAIVFNATGWLNIPDALASITPTYTVFVVEKRADSGARFFIGQQNATSAPTALILGYNSSTVSHHTNAYIVDLMVTIPAYAGAAEPVRITRYAYTGSTRSTVINGGEYSGSQSYSTTLTTWTNANIGAGYNVAANWYIGNIHEVIFFNATLTTPQSQAIESYLAKKWGIAVPSQALPVLHPFYATQPLNRIFNPVDVPGCILWLDAMDTTTFNGGGAVTNGTAITSWRDKSGLSNNATSTTTNKPTWSSACNALQFVYTNSNGIAGLLNTTYSSNTTVFLVMAYTYIVPYTDAAYPRFFNMSSNATFPNTANTSNLYGQLNLMFQYNGYSNPPYAWTTNANGPNSASGYTYAAVYIPTTSGNTNPTGLTSGTNLAIANAITVSNGSAGPGKPFIYTNASSWDGSTLTVNTFSNDYQAASSRYSAAINSSFSNYGANYNQYAIGNYPGLNAAAGDCFNGFIHEVVAYSNALSSNEIQLVQQYLARKWNIYSATPSNGNTASNFTPSNIIYTASPVMVSPTSISGCILWLDASHPSTTATSIRDLSGSGGSSSSFSGTPVLSNINGVKALGFNGTSYLLGGWPVSYGCNITTFAVATVTNSNANGLFSVGGAATGTLNTMVGTNIYFNYGTDAVMYNNNIVNNLANTFRNPTNIMLQSSLAGIPTTNGVPFIQVNRNTFVSSNIPGTAIGQGGSNVCFTELIYNGRSLSNQVAAPEYTGLTYGWGTFYPLSMNVWALGTGLLGPYTNPAPWIGCIGEVIVFSNVLNDTQRNQIEGYLAWKWGIQNRLPIQHPYYRFPPSITGSAAVIPIVPGTIATVTLSGLSGTGGTITWTASTNAVGYNWFVGTGAGTGQVATGTVGAVTTASVSFAFASGTNYYAWVIPFSSTGTNGATTVSAAASYTAGTPVLITATGAGSVSLGTGTQIVIECWGGGGGSMGQDNNNGASSGGAYSKTTISQTGAFILYYVVGAGGGGGQGSGGGGGTTWARIGTNSVPTVNTQGALAVGGSGAPVGSPNNSTQVANSIGQTIYKGGAGGLGPEGGGGGSASSLGDGSPGVSGQGTAGGAAGTGGGAGGAGGGFGNSGGNGISNVEGGGGGGGAYNFAGGQGGVPGGAGGMGWSTGGSPPGGSVNTNPHGFGGDGGRGQIRYTRT
jgi:hypothetical protein